MSDIGQVAVKIIKLYSYYLLITEEVIDTQFQFEYSEIQLQNVVIFGIRVQIVQQDEVEGFSCKMIAIFGSNS